MTATVTAKAATIGYRQRRPAHNTRAIRANRGYARPEKQTVEDHRPPTHGDRRPSTKYPLPQIRLGVRIPPTTVTLETSNPIWEVLPPPCSALPPGALMAEGPFSSIAR